MPDSKASTWNQLSTLAAADLLWIVDSSVPESKTITYSDFETQVQEGHALLAGGNVFLGLQDTTGGTMTAAPPTIDAHVSTKLYTDTAEADAKTYADQLAFSTALPDQTGNSGKYTTTNGTTASWADPFNNMAVTGTFTEEEEALSGTTPVISASATIKTWTLSGASTPTTTLATGQSVTLAITVGAHSVNWSSVVDVWPGGVAPTIAALAIVELTNIGGTVFGTHAGDYS